MDFYLLKAARTTAAVTCQRPLQGHDFSVQIIKNPNGEGPRRPTAVSSTEISILDCEVNHLSKAILNFVFVISFKTCYDFQKLNLLMHQYLIYLT